MRFLPRSLSLILVLFSLCAAQGSLKIEDPDLPRVHIDDSLFAESMSGFHRLLNALEIGTSIVDYRRELLDAKTALDPLIARFPKSQQRHDLEEAVNDYIVAADVWKVGIEFGDGIPTKTEFYRSLRARYKLEIEPKMGRKVNHDALLRVIWGIAAIRLEHSIKVQRATTQ